MNLNTVRQNDQSDTNSVAIAVGVELTYSHWGVSEVERHGDGTVTLKPWKGDPNPTPISESMADAYRSPIRISRPAVRAGWLEKGPGHANGARGNEPFVEVSWDEAFSLVAGEVQRVIETTGNESIFGGSYGWASAGRFHHAQGQVHRFLNILGGYVSRRESYSLAAGAVVMPYVVESMDPLIEKCQSWDTLAEHTRLFVSFGGAPAKNAQIGEGGVSEHRLPGGLAAMAKRGCRFVNFSPTGNDIDPSAKVDWHPIRPNTDTAVMLALATELIIANRHDVEFLNRNCVGFDRWSAYLLGESDGVVKDAQWAEGIAQVSAEKLRKLAYEMAETRTMVNVAWSLQRSDHGEQPFWAAAALASVLGQVGLPGGGFSVGYGPVNQMGSSERRLAGPRFPQGGNRVRSFIPVARIADALLKPGEPFAYQGKTRTYPSIKLVYWAGGNPFHHHQDLNRLAQAWQTPDTVIVHEQVWNPNARMADIVLPATTNLERHDLGYALLDPLYVPMRPIHEPYGEALDDYDIFAGIAEKLGKHAEFTEGRSSSEWLTHMYAENRKVLASRGVEVPSYEEFLAMDGVRFPSRTEQVILFASFRKDPEANPLRTPSGKIELYSETIASFGLSDCPGHAAWLEPAEWLGGALADRFPLHLISDQPHTKLHSQLDHSAYSMANKINGREPIRMHPDDAVSRGLVDGQVVRVFNDRGQCLAGVRYSESIRPGVVAIATGAWWDSERPGDPTSIDRHGNANVLTRDVGASSLSQGCAAQTCLVQVEAFVGELPPVECFTPPVFVKR